MSVAAEQGLLTSNSPSESTRKASRSRKLRRGSSLLAQGEPSIWGTGGALAVALAMIFGLLTLVFAQGVETFWPKDLIQVRTADGGIFLGEVSRAETYHPDPSVFDALPPEMQTEARASLHENGDMARRRLLRIGNFDLTGRHHRWVSDFQITEESRPLWALVVERQTWGNFYGTPTAFVIDGKEVATDPEAIWAEFLNQIAAVRERQDRAVSLNRTDIGAINRKEKMSQLVAKQAEIDYGKGSPEHATALQKAADVEQQCREESERISDEIAALNKENDRFQMRLVTAESKEITLGLAQIVRAYPANRLTVWDKVGVYLSRWGEFLTERPRGANTEGGVFPAIWGTVAMTLLMSLAVVPFGVLAALYLREYAKSGPIISAVRIAINNLAGVPSIVFGVFGLGFFCYLVGGFIDGGPAKLQIEPLPPAAWWILCVSAVFVGLCAFFTGVAGFRRATRGSLLGRYLGRFAVCLWLATLAALVFLVVRTPFFNGFYEASLPSPTFGTGGVLWASLTLALLTLPVVIVATEEALAAVPNSMREGSYACGASKWQTIRRIVLPRALPGIMTGMILAMARGAGEVAPLVLVGAAAMAPELPFDGVFPYLHPSRSFMHLGFHIFDVGFQSPDSEAARPMVFTTTLLLIAIVALLNVFAVWLRSRLRRRYLVSQF